MLIVIATGFFTLTGFLVKAWLDNGSLRSRSRRVILADLALWKELPEGFDGRGDLKQQIVGDLGKYLTHSKTEHARAEAFDRIPPPAMRLIVLAWLLSGGSVALVVLLQSAAPDDHVWETRGWVAVGYGVAFALALSSLAVAARDVLRARRRWLAVRRSTTGP